MRYNFHEELNKIKKNPQYVLPVDINQPVEDFLTKIGCTVGLKTLKRMRERIMYGTVEIVKSAYSTAKITIQVDCGIADGWKEYEQVHDCGWNLVLYKSVRNSNVDKKRLTKE